MGRLKANIVANAAGTAWSTLLGLAVVPVYLRLLGIEWYGVIGLFTTLQAVVALLDVGLSPTLNRELARATGTPESATQARGLLRTVELLNWGVALLIAATFLALSGVLATRWIHAEGVSADELRRALLLMGLGVAVQWPSTQYGAALLGLQRHVRLNSVTIVTSGVRHIGAVVILMLVSATPLAFFTWQIFAGLLHTGVMRVMVGLSLPRHDGGLDARPSWRHLRRVWRFAAGLSGVAVLKLLLTQGDKILLSTLITLEDYGYYTLAATVTSGVGRLINPVFTAYYPRLSELVARNAMDELRRVYHSGCQLVAVTVIPAAVVLSFFSHEALLTWTNQPEIARKAHVVLTLLATGTALNALFNIPYALQLANGWTQLAFTMNAAAVAVLIPALILAAATWGAVGAAATWLALNAGYLVYGIPSMHRRLLPDERRSWYLDDVARPLAASLAIAGILRLVMPVDLPRATMLVALVAIGLVTVTGAALAAPWTHHRMMSAIRRLQTESNRRVV